MASINGVSIKNLKSFMGSENPAVQGTVYLDGKKLGFWSQSGDGGENRFEFDKDLLRDAVLLAEAGDPDKSHEFYSLAMFMSDIVELLDAEKQYKYFIKKGHRFLAKVSTTEDFIHTVYFGTNKKSQMLEAEILDAAGKQYHWEKSEMSVEWFLSLEDFNISRGDKKDLPMLRAKADRRVAESKAAWMAAAEARNAELKEIDRITERFSFTPVANEPKVLVEDKATGRTTQVPNYAVNDVKRALADLVIGEGR